MRFLYVGEAKRDHSGNYMTSTLLLCGSECFSGELERGFSQKSRLSNVFLLERLGRSEYALLAHLKKLTHKAITNGLEENT